MLGNNITVSVSQQQSMFHNGSRNLMISGGFIMVGPPSNVHVRWRLFLCLLRKGDTDGRIKRNNISYYFYCHFWRSLCSLRPVKQKEGKEIDPATKSMEESVIS
jgi:hypothetical protein